LKVSEIALGSWWSFGQKTDRQTAIKCIHRAFELGINFFDTADIYAEGEAERIVGEALKDLPREQVVLATKARGRMWPGPLGEGLSRKHLFEALHASLRRLQVDYIDLYQVHWPDPDCPIDETLKALDDMVRQGKVLYVGCSNFTAAQIEEAARYAERYGITRFDSVQPRYNMFNREIEEELLPYCGRRGVGVVVYSPLAQGLLSGKYRKGQDLPAGSRWAERGLDSLYEHYGTDCLDKVEQLIGIARRLGRSLSQLALAWVLRRSEVTSAIIGATRPEQIEDNVGASGWRIPDEVLAEIERIFGRSEAGGDG